jgi:hypothetical protein
MCVGLGAIVGAALSVAQAVVSFSAAQDEYEQKAEQWRQNYTNSLAAGRDDQRQITLRMTQEEEAKSQKTTQNRIEGAEVSAEAEVSAAAAGLSGISLDNIMTGITRKVAMKQAADEATYQNTAAQLTTQLEATNTSIQNRINSVQRPTAPDPLGYVLKGIGGALGKFD